MTRFSRLLSMSFLIVAVATAFLGKLQTAHAVEAFCPGGSSPQARIIFCEDWDGTSPNPPSNFPNTRGSSWNGWTVNNDGSTEGLGELTNTRVRSGTRSLHQVKYANQYSVPLIMKNIPPTTTFRMRFYVYFDSNVANLGSYAGSEDYVHFIFLQSAMSGRGVRLDILPAVNKTGAIISNISYAWPPTCISSDPTGHLAGYFGLYSPSGQGSTYKGVTQTRTDLCFDIRKNLQRWILVEWAYRIVNTNEGRASLWIDGTQRMLEELLPPDPGYMTINNVMLSGFMSTLRAYDIGFYIDDIVVSNDYFNAIGPSGSSGGSTIPKPPAPQNLVVVQ